MRKIFLTIALSFVLLAGSFVPASAGVPVGSVSEYPPQVYAYLGQFSDYVWQQRFLISEYPELTGVTVFISWVPRPGDEDEDLFENRTFLRDSTNSFINVAVPFERVEDISLIEINFINSDNSADVDTNIVFVNQRDVKLPMILNASGG